MVFEYIYPKVDSSQNSMYKNPSSSLCCSYKLYTSEVMGGNLLLIKKNKAVFELIFI